MHSSTIKEGDQIIIKTAKVLKVFQVRKNRVIRVEKTKFYLDDAIGAYYGSSFEAKGGRLVKIDKTTKDENVSTEKESDRDNRHLKDTAENQKLKKEDIQALRKGGASGHEIVDQLVVNSSTFNEKTEFSQEKYIKKKKKKHVADFTILKPNTRLLAKMYFSKGPTKICNLRYDAIAQILTQANVHAGCKLMMFESVVGLLVGAVLERLAGKGEVVQFYTGSAPARQAMEAYDFPTEVKQCLLSFPLDQVSTLSRDHCKCCQPITSTTPTTVRVPKVERHASSGDLAESIPVPTYSTATVGVKSIIEEKVESPGCNEVKENEKEVEVDEDVKSPQFNDDLQENKEESLEMAEDVKCKEDGNGDTEEKKKKNAESPDIQVNDDHEKGKKRKLEWDAEKEQRRQYRQAELAKSRSLLETADMDGLIVAGKLHPTPIVMSLIDFVAPSRPVVIFSQYKEPLLDCYVKLRNRGGVVNMRLSETWLRHYQVLPNRTHPEINMSSAGGYLLTGTTVIMDKSTTQQNNS